MSFEAEEKLNNRIADLEIENQELKEEIAKLNGEKTNQKPHWEMTKDEKDKIDQLAWEDIEFKIIHLQLNTNRLYRFRADCNPVESSCPASKLINSTSFYVELVDDLGLKNN